VRSSAGASPYPLRLAVTVRVNGMDKEKNAEPKRRRQPARGVLSLHYEKTIVFVTVCTEKRRRWLACDEAHELLVRCWRSAAAWMVGSYVIMPDHLHLFAMPSDERFTIERWLQFWKSQFTKGHGHMDWEWQPYAFHHRLRNSDDPRKQLVYMRENPVRAGLVRKGEEWRFMGKVFEEVV
jgi:putative transposase